MGLIKSTIKLGIAATAVYFVYSAASCCIAKYDFCKNEGVKGVVNETGSYLKRAGEYLEKVGNENTGGIEGKVAEAEKNSEKTAQQGE